MSHHESQTGTTSLTTLEQLDDLLAKSWERPAVIFKHSETCGLSAMAEEEVAGWLNAAHSAADVYVVEVRRSRAVARGLADRLNVRHESPQVLLVRDGRVCWHRSHAAVTARAIEAALLAQGAGSLT